jgi:Fic family protein
MIFLPKFEITPSLTKQLMTIEASRQKVSTLPITVSLLTSLQESARLTSTHYSTQIEGNHLTQEQVKAVIQGETLPNRERDEQEVRNYYLALEYINHLIKEEKSIILETHIKTIHGLVSGGKEAPTPYREGQNVIRESGHGTIIYMPPESSDVPVLMQALIDWINDEKRKDSLPIPIIASIAHYQCATIHPYYDGNGRTARLLTTLILHQWGYGLKGIYSLEEYYAKSLQAYYKALTIGPSHNYYLGRAEADITPWIMYFCSGMAASFATICIKAEGEESDRKTDCSTQLRQLDHRQKQVLTLFIKSKFITTKEIANKISIHRRSALNLCKKWIGSGFITQHGDSNKTRCYKLADQWHSLLH